MPRPSLSAVTVAGLVAVVVTVVTVVTAVGACVVYRDRCLGVACDTGEVCIDLAAGPRCVCDDDHELTEDGCVPLEDGEGGSSG